MKKYNQKERSFLKSIMTLASGSVLAQVITILASPLTTRIYSPSELGVFTFITTAVNMFGVVINGRIEMAIVTDNDENNVYPLIVISFIIDLILSVLVSLGYLIYFICFKKEYLWTVLFIFSLLFVTGLINILNSYNNRYREYKLMTSVFVTRTVTQNVLTILLGLIKNNVFNLLLSQILGLINGLRKQSKVLLANRDKLKIHINFRNIIKKQRKYLIYSIPASFMNGFSYSSINLFIQNLFGMEMLGFYSISYRVLGIPLNIISNNVSRVFIQDATVELNKYGNYKNSFKKNFLFLIIMSLLLIIGLTFIIPDLCTLFFGESWAQVGDFIRILAPMFGIRLMVSALASGLIVSNKQNLEMLLQSLLFIASLICFFVVSVFKLHILVYLKSINILFSIIYLLFLFIIYKDSLGNFQKY